MTSPVIERLDLSFCEDSDDIKRVCESNEKPPPESTKEETSRGGRQPHNDAAIPLCCDDPPLPPRAISSRPPVDEIDWILAPLAVTILRMNLTITPKPRSDESNTAFAIQTCIPFAFAGAGLLLAGLLLEHAATTHFFVRVPQALVLVPVLLGLKGNLEMTFAARLSTLANVGLLETRSQVVGAFMANMALIQTQAIVVSAFAVLVSTTLKLAHSEQKVDSSTLLSLMVTSVGTAALISLALGSFMMAVVLAAKKFSINPDNVTTPVAASLGDVSTLAFMMWLGGFVLHVESAASLALVLAAFGALAILAAGIAARSHLTRDVLRHGWWSVLSAMFIGCASGVVLKAAVSAFPGLALFQPLINGIGGNMSAVQTSRISTSLHRAAKAREEDTRPLVSFLSPLRAFASKERDSTASRILLLISGCGHALFLVVIFASGASPYSLSAPLAIAYMAVAVGQVALLLFVCQWLVRALWTYRVDPDSSAIPLLTALGDLAGTALLLVAFGLLDQMGAISSSPSTSMVDIL